MELVERKLEDRKQLIQVASGEREADLILQNCKLVNLFTEEIYTTDIAIYRGRIASISAKQIPAKKQLDCSGLFAVPGLIDGHIHIESTLLTPQNLAKIILPKGVTTLFIDPHELANVSGIEGIRTFLKGVEKLPLQLLLQIPSRVPTAPGLETTGGVLGLDETKEMLLWEDSVCLGELDPSKVVPPLDEYIMKVLLTEERGKIPVGHAAGLEGLKLDGYAAGGLRDDHEAVTLEEAMERLRRGIEIMIREGTAERNLTELVRLVTEMGVPSEFLFFCTDDKHVNDIETEGHIDFNIRKAISAGVPAIQAIKMATYNCARHFRVDHMIGCIAPGRLANVVLVKSINDFHAHMVFAKGELVAENNVLLGDIPPINWPDWIKKTVHIGNINPDAINVKASGTSTFIKVIDLIEGQIVNHCAIEELPVINGNVLPDPKRDILKIICVDRHKSTGTVGLGFVRGFNLKQGAIGSSVSHDHHNIVAVGTNDEDIMVVIQAINTMQGGLAIAYDGEIIGRLELPLFGLMSQLTPEEMNRAIERINKVAYDLGCHLKGPFMTLSFVSLPTVPELGLTNMGLIDVVNHKITSLFV